MQQSNSLLKIMGLALAMSLGGVVQAASASDVVNVHAFDANGNGLNTCLASTSRGLQLISCGSGGDQVSIDTDLSDLGAGGASLRFLNSDKCLAMIDPPESWRDGTAVFQVDCDSVQVDGSQAIWSSWRWSGPRLMPVEAVNTLCLTSIGNQAPTMRLRNCSNPMRLTQWDVLRAP